MNNENRTFDSENRTFKKKNGILMFAFFFNALMFLIVIASVIKAFGADFTYIDITEGPETAIYIPDCEDDTPYNDAVPLSDELQHYLWEKCKAVIPEKTAEMYVFMLGLIDAESTFNPRAKSKTGDYGLCQTNKKYVYPDVKKAFGLNDITDCYDPYISINCCFWELLHKLDSYGISERLYYYYNTGKTSGSSNANSRRMVGLWNKWKEEFSYIL